MSAPEPGAAAPGQAAYEAHPFGGYCPWDEIAEEDRASWEAIAQAAIAAQQPAPGAVAPDRPNAKFTEWLELHNAQFGGNPTHEYGGGDMRDAYEAGMTAAVVAYACRPDLGAQPDALAALRSGITGLAADLDRSYAESGNKLEAETAIMLRRLLETP